MILPKLTAIPQHPDREENNMTFLMDMLSFAFIRRALLVGIFVSLCAALLGVSLVLKRFSMIGDGLSHVSFGALSVALAFGGHR